MFLPDCELGEWRKSGGGAKPGALAKLSYAPLFYNSLIFRRLRSYLLRVASAALLWICPQIHPSLFATALDRGEVCGQLRTAQEPVAGRYPARGKAADARHRLRQG